MSVVDKMRRMRERRRGYGCGACAFAKCEDTWGYCRRREGMLSELELEMDGEEHDMAWEDRMCEACFVPEGCLGVEG